MRNHHYPAAIETKVIAQSESEVEIQYILENSKPEREVLYAALVQKKAVVNIGRGENRGRKLEHINIVRELKAVWPKDQGNIRISYPAGLERENAFILLFLQNEKDKAIQGSSVLYF